MDKMIERFPEQIREAIKIAESIEINNISKDSLHNILVAGLGGSGIGGNFVSHFLRDTLSIPYIVSKSYDIPQFVNSHTLFIASSYSGNTEETLESYDQAIQAGAQIFVISSGGKLIEKAIEYKHDYVKVPDDWASPRACLGYSLIQQFGLLQKLGFISDLYQEQFEKARQLILEDQDHIKQKAQQLAHFLAGKTAVIYSSDVYEPVAIRWRQQLNENSKSLAWHHVVPEMNHNELVGWRDQRNDLAVIMMRNKDDHPRVQLRMDINKEIISKYAGSYIELISKGNSKIERAMYLVHIGDWASWYLSEIRDRDAIEVDVIDYLKGELKKY